MLIQLNWKVFKTQWFPVVMVNKKHWNPCFKCFALGSDETGNCLGHTKLKVYYWSISLYRALPEGWDEQAQEMKPKMGKWEGDQVVHQDKAARLKSGVWRKGGSRGERWGKQNNSGWSWEPSSCSGKCITCLWMKPTGRNRCDGRKMELFTSLLINR